MTYPNTDSATLEAVFSIPFPHGIGVVLRERIPHREEREGFSPRLSPWEELCDLAQSYFLLFFGSISSLVRRKDMVGTSIKSLF